MSSGLAEAAEFIPKALIKKRILYCIAGMGGGGAERQLCYLCQGLVDLGWEVHVAMFAGGPNEARLRASKAHIHILPHYRHHDPRWILEISRLIRDVQPDVVHTFLLLMDVVGGVACRLTGVPWIASERNSALAYPPGWKTKLRSFVDRHSDAIIANSFAGMKYWRTHAPKHPGLYLVPNALPLAEIESCPPEQNIDSAHDHSAPLIMFAGRLTEQKNLETLLHALASLAAKCNFVVRLFGEGPSRHGLKRLIEQLNVGDRVLLPGYVQNLWSWMKNASVFVSVSLFEGRPNTIMEAMACSCPLVVSDIAEHREILDADTALMVDPQNAEQISTALLSALTDRDASLRRARKAKERIAEWSTEYIVRDYDAIYRKHIRREIPRHHNRSW